MPREFPVYVTTSTGQHRVGTAVQTADGFGLLLGDLSLGKGVEVSASQLAAANGPTFPNYGKSKGRPVAGASMNDLRFYGNGCIRTLSDPGKSRWHDKERALLAAINAEIARQGGEQLAVPEPGAPADDGFGAPAGPPKSSDDDIPF